MPDQVKAGDTNVSVPALIGALENLFDTRDCTSHKYWTAMTAARVLKKYVLEEPVEVSHQNIEYQVDEYTIHARIQYLSDGTTRIRSLFKE